MFSCGNAEQKEEVKEVVKEVTVEITKHGEDITEDDAISTTEFIAAFEGKQALETKIKGRSLIKFTLEENRDPDMIRALLIDGFNRYSKHEDPKKLKWLTELFSCEEFKEKRHGFLLELASKDSHPIFSIVPSLLSEEDVSMTRINDGTTLLHQATKHCAVQNVESLLKLGANPKKDDVLGNTPYSIIQNKISSLHTPKKDKGGCKEILTLMERKMGVDNRDRSRSEHPGRSPSPDTVDPVNSSEYKGGYR